MGTILDCMSTYPHVAPRNKLPTIREITSRLGRTSHIAGEDLTIADLAVVSLIKKNDLAKDLQPEAKKWFQSFSDTANKSNISPKKSRKESEKTSQKSATKEEKSAKKEKSPNKPIKKEKSPDKNHGKENSPPSSKLSKAELFDFLTTNKIAYTNVDHPE